LYALRVGTTSACDAAARLERAARDELSAAGVELCGDATDVLLLAPSAADGTVGAVRSARLRGARRVLVAVPSTDCLLGPAVWDALDAGACDVFCWSEGPAAARNVRARLERWREVDELLESDLVAGNLIGSSPAFRATLRELIEIGRFTDSSVLITGESGTGKELAARLIHALDSRPRKGELVVVDCTTVVPSLSGSEFFGHERGAFTGAVAAREGAFAMAAGGTVFLDEVGELPLELQAELLRVVQERAYKPVGSNRWRETDFRLICATNRDLEREHEAGGFRRDFYFRIAEWTLRLPSLRERREDIEPLARSFASALAPGRAVEFDPPVLSFLQHRDFAGNVRELRQVVARLVHAHIGSGPITVGDIPADERACAIQAAAPDPLSALDRAVEIAIEQGLSLKELTGVTRDAAIRSALTGADGSVRRAAQRLRVTERAIQLHRARRTEAEPGD
jgi:transcriptional regulator with GAF, ATPase, and Fis domain